MGEHFTYAHFKKSNGSIFYIGKGTKRRMSSIHNRSNYWKSTVAKHGFVVEPLAKWPTEQEAFQHEKFLIWCFRDMGVNIVNITDGGDGVSGLRHSPEAKRKMSIARSGDRNHGYGKPSPNRGVAMGEEQKQKISKANKGRKNTEETKAKLSAALKGRVISDETKKKMSDARKGKKLSAEHCKRISEGKTGDKHHFFGKPSPRRGMTHTDEAKQQMSLIKQGKKASEETKLKMSESQKLRRAKNRELKCKS